MTDRFDEPRRLGRVGVHRAHERRWWRWWMTLACAAAACLLLVVAGVAALSFLRVGQIDVPPAAVVQPSVDPSGLPEDVTITVLDASGSDAGEAIEVQLQDAGWPVITTVNADSQTVDSGVYYQDAALEPWALGLAGIVGGQATVTEQEITGSPITIVVGSDGGVSPTTSP